ncbi:MAG: hypothetical protein ACRC1Z_08665 [Waterburya sp.]
MANNQKHTNWDDALITSQVLHLLVAFGFMYQQKYLEAASLLFFGGLIGLGKTKNSIIKFLNRMILSLATIMGIYWVYLETHVK